jgi:hypothetical protein
VTMETHLRRQLCAMLMLHCGAFFREAHDMALLLLDSPLEVCKLCLEPGGVRVSCVCVCVCVCVYVYVCVCVCCFVRLICKDIGVLETWPAAARYSGQ